MASQGETGQEPTRPPETSDGTASTATPPPAASGQSPERSRAARLVRNKRFVRLVALIIMLGLLYYAFFIALPAEIDWSEVGDALSALSWTQIAALGLSGVIVMICLGWAAKASLPGLSLYQGFESSGTSQMTAFVVPPPGDYVIRFSMYRSYGFTDEQSGVSVLIAMVLRYLAIVFMAALGYGLALIAGVAPSDGLAWFVVLTVGLALVVFFLQRTIASDDAAHAVGRWIDSVVTRVMHTFRKTPSKDLEASVVSFGSKVRGAVYENWKSLFASNIVWGLSNVLVVGMVVRFSGLDTAKVSLAAIFLTTGVLMMVNILPIPGKDALVAPALFTMLVLTTQAEQSALTAALVLFRVVTWIEPMLVGCVLFLAWRYRVRRDTVTTVNDELADTEHAVAEPGEPGSAGP